MFNETAEDRAELSKMFDMQIDGTTCICGFVSEIAVHSNICENCMYQRIKESIYFFQPELTESQVSDTCSRIFRIVTTGQE